MCAYGGAFNHKQKTTMPEELDPIQDVPESVEPESVEPEDVPEEAFDEEPNEEPVPAEEVAQ